MHPTMLKILSGALLLCSAAVAMESATATTNPTLSEIAHYRKWTRVTEKPIPIVSSVAGGD